MAYKMVLRKDVTPLKLYGKGKGVRNHKLKPYKGGVISGAGTRFDGLVIYLRMPNGFEKMVRVEGQPDIYFPSNAVSYIDKPKSIEELAFSGAAGRRTQQNAHAIPRGNPHAIPRAGEIMPFMRRNNPDFVAGGEIEGDIHTAPHIADEVYSGFNGNGQRNDEIPFGVQAGQIYRQDGMLNPFQVEGGQIEGVHETDSHEYSEMKGYGLKAGAIAQNWDAHDDRFGLEAGMIQGAQPETQIASWVNAGGNYVDDSYGDGEVPYGVQAGQIQGRYDIARAYRYPNLLGLHQVNPNTLAALPQYSALYPQYSADGAVEIGGEEWDIEFSDAKGDFWKKIFGTKGSREAKRKERDARKAERNKLAAKSESKVEFTEEEMAALYKKSGTTKSFDEWRKSNRGRDIAGNLVFIASTLLARGRRGDERDVDFQDDFRDDFDTGKKKKILGMHPVTFGIIAGVVVIGGILTVVLLTRKK